MITLKNESLEVKILKRGVTFISFKSLKDNINIITAYRDVEDYKDNKVYLGSCIGPLAGRCEPGYNDLDLDINNPPNHLHGGKNGISYQEFDVIHTNTEATFTLSHQSIAYVISVKLECNSVVLDFKATPQNPRPINLTNHMYFNLMGTNNLNGHKIKLNAQCISYLNEKKLNTNDIRKVENTVFDLNDWRKVDELLKDNNSQFDIIRHIDHSFIGQEVWLKTDKKELSIQATMPVMQLYFSNYFDNSFIDEHGRRANNHASIAIEPQYIPNGKDLPLYTNHSPYHETITYTLKTD